jgi:CIC family chloride channel protein
MRMDNPAPSQPASPSNPLHWFPEFLEIGRKRLRGQARLLGAAILVGIVAGTGAIAFYLLGSAVAHYSMDLIAGYTPHHPGNEPELFRATGTEFSPWLLLIVPAAGGILSGLLVYTLAPEAEGHGTDAAIAAYHYQQGRIRPQVPLIKIVASALTLGSGGSGGREGPIAQIGAGFGSFLGGLLRLRPAERRILMAAGMGAGVGAIFRAPLAGALFAAEVLYRSPEFEAEVIIPAGLASVTAYSTYALVFSSFGVPDIWKPLFDLTGNPPGVLAFSSPFSLLLYLGLAVFLAVLAMVYTRSFYGFNYLFKRIPLKPHFKPAIGAFLSAIVGVALYFVLGSQQVLSVLSFGYGILQDALATPDGLEASASFAILLLAVALGKILTTCLTIGSGGSGGVFGPSMVIGGCGGGALGILFRGIFGAGIVPHPANFAIVGMAGFFAAAAKTPFSTLVIVSEMTGNYNLLLPSLWVCALAFLLSDEESIYSSQVQSRSRSPAHQGDYVREVLTGVTVGQFAATDQAFPTLRAGDALEKVIDGLGKTGYPILPVVDDNGRLIGVVNLEEVHIASLSPHLRSLVVAADLMRTDVVPLQTDDRLDRALELFVENDLLALPIVNNTSEKRVTGIVRRIDISSAYLRHVHGATSSQL